MRFRIVLDLAALILLIACLAYWWLGNLAHELLGTAFFALIISHNTFNRRWYGVVAKGRQDVPRILNTVFVVGLALSMTVMLVTSILISRDLYSVLALDGAFTVREIHMFTAYWAFMVVALHLGTRWGTVMMVARRAFGIAGESRWRRSLLRLAAAAIALNGLLVSSEMGFADKLMWRYALDMWDFTAQTPRFFLNWLSIVGLYACISHYGLKMLRVAQRGRAGKTDAR